MAQVEHNKPLFLFVGKSASGKTTIANMLESDGYSQVNSYTTRQPRYEGEIGHIFISEEKYNQLDNIVASTFYNGYHYCTTLDQVQNADIYVIDPNGIETLLEHFNVINRPIYVFYFVTTICNRIQRMRNRHDSDTNIVSRLYNDEATDWKAKLYDIQAKNYWKMSLVPIGANQEVQEVYQYVKGLIKIYEKRGDQK